MPSWPQQKKEVEVEEGDETRSLHPTNPWGDRDQGQEDLGENPHFIRIPDDDILPGPVHGKKREHDRLHNS